VSWRQAESKTPTQGWRFFRLAICGAFEGLSLASQLHSVALQNPAPQIHVESWLASDEASRAT
jgi:hypothetical protein